MHKVIVNGSSRILRKARYFVNRERRRYLRSCIVEIPGSDGVPMPHLPQGHFPILPADTAMELKFYHGGSHKRRVIKQKQVSIELGFTMTVHNAQAQTVGGVRDHGLRRRDRTTVCDCLKGNVIRCPAYL